MGPVDPLRASDGNHGRSKLIAALGPTQFTEGTWVGLSKQEGTYLHENSEGLDRTALLKLRTDPTFSIVSAAELDQRELTTLMKLKGADGNPLLPRNMTDDQKAFYMYIGHHDGSPGASQVLLGTMPSSEVDLRIEQNMTPRAQERYIKGSSLDARRQGYRQWLFDYASAKVRPERYRAH
jgi:hypothetical protein